MDSLVPTIVDAVRQAVHAVLEEQGGLILLVVVVSVVRTIAARIGDTN